MSEPCTAEVLPVLVTVRGKAFFWTVEDGLDPAAATQMEPWIWATALSLRFPAAKAGHSVDDLVQEGRIGALVAARAFDPFHKSGAGFFTYARFKMLAPMLDALQRGDLHISDRDWAEMRRNRIWPSVASLDSSPLPDGQRTLLDRLPAPQSAGTDIGLTMLRVRLRAALGALPAQDREVIIRHFGLSHPDGEGEAFESIASDWGLSRQRVQQIEKRAQMRLRRALAKKGITRW
jgi:RNA polymerase sigma factor (sigma-70 family)